MSPRVEAFVRGLLKMGIGFALSAIAYFNADPTPSRLEFITIVIGPFLSSILVMLDRSPLDVWDGKRDRRNGQPRGDEGASGPEKR